MVGVGAGVETAGGGVLPVHAAEGEGEVGIETETGTEIGTEIEGEQREGKEREKGRGKETTKVEAGQEEGPDLRG